VNPISELRDVTCRMGSHSVTCRPTQVKHTPPNPSHVCQSHAALTSMTTTTTTTTKL